MFISILTIIYWNNKKFKDLIIKLWWLKYCFLSAFGYKWSENNYKYQSSLHFAEITQPPTAYTETYKAHRILAEEDLFGQRLLQQNEFEHFLAYVD